MWNDFKNFAFKGNAFDLAVGVVMGTAFGAIVTSVVNDMLMPIISVITGGTNFSSHWAVLSGTPKSADYAAAAKEATLFGYGNFIQVLITFLAIAAFLFVLVRFSSSLKRSEPPAPPPAASKTEVLLQEIRDGLMASPAKAAKK